MMLIKATITLNLTDAQFDEYTSEYGVQDGEVREMVSNDILDAIQHIYAVREGMVTLNSIVTE